jgi:hypothetical protein
MGVFASSGSIYFAVWSATFLSEAKIVLLCILQGICKKKQTPWPLARERTIPTKRSPLVGEVSVNVCG